MSAVDSGPKAGRTGLRAALLAIAASATLAAAGCSEKSEPDVHPPTVPTPTVTAPGAGTTTGTTATQPAPATPTAPAPAPPQQP